MLEFIDIPFLYFTDEIEKLVAAILTTALIIYVLNPIYPFPNNFEKKKEEKKETKPEPKSDAKVVSSYISK